MPTTHGAFSRRVRYAPKHLRQRPSRRVGWRITALLGAAAVLVIAPPAGASTTWNTGDVFVAVSSGSYNVYNNGGTFKETISEGLGGTTTGCAFNGNQDKLYTTTFSRASVVVYNVASPHAIVQTISTFGSESVVFAANGHFFVGGPGAPIQEYDAAGTLVDSDTVVSGSDWIDLAADQSTMFYDNEGRTIGRFNVASNVQLSPFATLPGSGNAFALRLLPPGNGTGGLIVADRGNIKRLNGSGAVVQTYDVAGEDSWFALNLDPNGTSFWSADFGTDNFYRFNIATGAVEVGPISAGAGGTVFGLCVKGEITVARDTTRPSCTIARSGTTTNVTFRDTESGLAAITNLGTRNATATIPPFSPGTNNPVTATLNRVNTSQPGSVRLRATDVRGNVKFCTLSGWIAT